MEIFSENINNILKRVSEASSGDGLKEIWIEEGLDTGFSTVPTFLYDTLIDLKTNERTQIHNGESNLIVINFRVLVASLLKGDPTYGFPITYWAVGEGEGDYWDDLSVEARQNKSNYLLESLYNEIYRQPVNIEYIDENDDVVTGPTNRLEVRAVFGPDVIGTLREFGLYGGNATITTDSGLLIDHKSHTAINLNNTPGQQNVLIRAIRIRL